MEDGNEYPLLRVKSLLILTHSTQRSSKIPQADGRVDRQQKYGLE